MEKVLISSCRTIRESTTSFPAWTSPFQIQVVWLKKELFSVLFLAGRWLPQDISASIEKEPGRRGGEEAALRIRDGMSVHLPRRSPEPDGPVQPFKKGGFTLAIKSKVSYRPCHDHREQRNHAQRTMDCHIGRDPTPGGSSHETRHCSLKDRNFLMERVRQTIIGKFWIARGKPRRSACLHAAGRPRTSYLRMRV